MLARLSCILLLSALAAANKCCSLKTTEDACLFDIDCAVMCVYREENGHCRCVDMTNSNLAGETCVQTHMHRTIADTDVITVGILVVTVVICFGVILFILSSRRNKDEFEQNPQKSSEEMVPLQGPGVPSSFYIVA